MAGRGLDLNFRSPESEFQAIGSTSMDTGASGAPGATRDSPSRTTGGPARLPLPSITVVALPVELEGTRISSCSRPVITDWLSARWDSLPMGEEEEERRLCLILFFFLSFLYFLEHPLAEGEDNVASELPSSAPGDMVPTRTMIGSVQPESYVTVCALSTLAPG